MQDVIHPLASSPAVVEVADIALDKGEARPLVGRDEAHDLIQVALVAGGEVVEADDPLIELEKGLEQVGPDEAGYAGDEPGLRVLGEVEAEFFVARHGCSMGRNAGNGGRVCKGGRRGRVRAWRRSYKDVAVRMAGRSADRREWGCG